MLGTEAAEVSDPGCEFGSCGSDVLVLELDGPTVDERQRECLPGGLAGLWQVVLMVPSGNRKLGEVSTKVLKMQGMRLRQKLTAIEPQPSDSLSA